MNRRIVLAARPAGMPRVTDFALAADALPNLAPGEFLIEARYLSADPLQRWRMEESTRYGTTISIGELFWGRMVGEVVRSRNPDWPEGDHAEGMLGWQEYAILKGDTGKVQYARGVSRVNPAIAPISTSLGILGMPGVTAYFALTEICNPQAGETVVVSAAAGAVGSLAGQIAKIRGCRVVGIAGGPEKVRHLLEDLGFDAAIDYRQAHDLPQALRAACPDGIDCYFDNVGGTVADEAMAQLAPRARVALVGRIAQLGGDGARADRQEHLIAARARVEGFIVYDYVDRAEEAHAAIASWLREGSLRFYETVHVGLESAPQALIDVLAGKGVGKHVIRLSRP